MGSKTCVMCSASIPTLFQYFFYDHIYPCILLHFYEIFLLLYLIIICTESATVPQPPASEQVQPHLVEGAVSVHHTSRELHSICSGRNDSVSSTGE